MRKSPAGELGLVPHLTILSQLHTEASGSIFAHFQIEQSGSMMPQPHSGPPFASNAQWVIWADLYPSAACLNRHDTDRAAGESPKHGKLSRRGKKRHNGFVVDGTGLAAANLSSAERKRNSVTAHRKPWHAGQGEERKCLSCGQSTGLWRLPCEVRQAFVHAW